MKTFSFKKKKIKFLSSYPIFLKENLEVIFQRKILSSYR